MKKVAFFMYITEFTCLALVSGESLAQDSVYKDIESFQNSANYGQIAIKIAASTERSCKGKNLQAFIALNRAETTKINLHQRSYCFVASHYSEESSIFRYNYLFKLERYTEATGWEFLSSYAGTYFQGSDPFAYKFPSYLTDLVSTGKFRISVSSEDDTRMQFSAVFLAQ
ncbi:MAG: hypothetical protein CME90_11410 [Hoeflea sp.]|nr:hypothetical protein [Hoeflea sp.]|tara:strand:+ start:1243 stop:1752 length:510 start_codon:yes stop_codon:yes gene_type:complete